MNVFYTNGHWQRGSGGFEILFHSAVPQEGRRSPTLSDQEGHSQLAARLPGLLRWLATDLERSMALEQNNQLLPEPNQQWARFGEIGVYGISVQGSSHIMHGTPCQDNNGFVYLEPEGILVAAVADGVGSCEKSHWGAVTAVSASISAIAKQLRTLSGEKPLRLSELSGETVEKLFHNAFGFALQKINRLARKEGCAETLYQTTLSAAIYDGSGLACCHIGDGGIVAQGVSGSYRMITERIKGEEAGSVVPLQSGRWQITRVSTEVTGFLMATDGVLDYYVSGKALKNRVYYPFFEKCIYGMAVQPDMHEERPIEKTFRKTCAYFRSEEFLKNVTDDITVLAAANQRLLQTAVHPRFSREDWEEESRRFLEEKKKMLYPGKNEKTGGQEPESKTGRSAETDSDQHAFRLLFQRKHQPPAAAPENKRQPSDGVSSQPPERRTASVQDRAETTDDVQFVCNSCGLRIVVNRKKHPMKMNWNCPYCGEKLKLKRRTPS